MSIKKRKKKRKKWYFKKLLGDKNVLQTVVAQGTVKSLGKPPSMYDPTLIENGWFIYIS